jgi:ABC-2 type transport system permease protein
MEYLRLLFWLKWKLMFRGYRRDLSAVFGVVMALLIFFPLAIVLAGGCLLGFLKLEPPRNEHLLRAALLGIYLFWVLTPLLGFALSDSYDITRLFLYPLSLQQIFTAAILGSLIDFPVLFLLPVLVAVLIGFTHSALSFVFVGLGVALFLFHTLSMSQAILMASAGVLRSRRFRDIAIVLIPLFWMGYYIFSQMLSRQAIEVDWTRFLQSRTWEILSLLPSGFAARAIAAAGRGEWGLSLGFVLGLAAFTIGTVYAAGWILQKLYAGEVEGGAGPRRAGRKEGKPIRPSVAGAPRRRSAFSLPPVVEAVVDKEIRYLARDPAFKIALMNLVYMLVVATFVFLRPSRHEGFQTLGPGMAWGATGWVLLSEMQLLFNIFGTEGGAATVLFLFPSSRRQMLIGKNLTLFAALSAVNLVFMMVLAALAGAMHLFGPLFCWMERATIVFIAAGNLVSIWFPFRVVTRSWRMRQQSASHGCGFSFLYMGIAAGAFVMLLPILALLLLPAFWVDSGWFALTIPLATAYALGLYTLSLKLSEPLLLRREIEITEKVGQTE